MADDKFLHVVYLILLLDLFKHVFIVFINVIDIFSFVSLGRILSFPVIFAHTFFIVLHLGIF